jgi:outer membrane protein OmpA-like peptidoglycan-associated protein
MKKFLPLLLLVAALVPACKKNKDKKQKNSKHSTNMPLSNSKYAKSSFFDEKLDGFVLEDDEKAASLASNSAAPSWVSDADTTGFNPIHFAFDSSAIRPDQEAIVNSDIKVAEKIVRKGSNLVVEGHADHAAGSKAYNLLISEHRAQEVAHRLENAGIAQDKIKIVGRGNELPVILGGNKDEQAPNRRVELFPLSV